MCPESGETVVDCGEKLNVAASAVVPVVGLDGAVVRDRMPSGGLSWLPKRPLMKARRIPPSVRAVNCSCSVPSREWAVPSVSNWHLTPSTNRGTAAWREARRDLEGRGSSRACAACGKQAVPLGYRQA